MIRYSLHGALLAALGACNPSEANHASESAPASVLAAGKFAPTATPVAAPSPTKPAPDGLDGFTQVLGRTLDRTQMISRPASAAGGVLHLPNGHAAHAAVVVRGPDGRLKRGCVSTPAEVSALVQQMRDGAGQ